MRSNAAMCIVLAIIAITQGVIYLQQNKPTSGTRGAVTELSKHPIIAVNDSPVEGLPTAKVFMLEFSDYECPFCASYVRNTEAEVEKEFVDTGKIRYAFVNNPLPIHKDARLLAAAAWCAGQQTSYWRAHKDLFSVRPRAESEILDLADRLNIGTMKFEACLSSSATSEKIDRDSAISQSIGVLSTPTFGLGRVGSDGRIEIERVVKGAQPISVFSEAIERTLKN